MSVETARGHELRHPMRIIHGSALVETLKEAQIPVVEARPPRRAIRAGHGKSDAIDAEAAARSVLGQDHAHLIHPRVGKLRSALRVLLVARRSMDTQRTAARNSLTALLRMVDLGVDVRAPLTDKQVSITAASSSFAEARCHARDWSTGCDL